MQLGYIGIKVLLEVNGFCKLRIKYSVENYFKHQLVMLEHT